MMKKLKKHNSISKWNVIKADFRINKSLYLLVLPVLIYFAVFWYTPMYGALIAFKNYSPRLGVMASDWVGFDHFVRFFTSPSFFTLLWNTLRISFASLLFGFPAPILLALMLNELRSKRFGKLVQNFTYLPHFISLVVI